MDQNTGITTIYVVRHAESFGNAAYDENKRETSNIYGELQSPLTDLGKQQAAKIAEVLKNVSFAAIFTSDLNRARETAEYIAEPHNMSVTVDPTIRERINGLLYEKKSKKEQLELVKTALANLTDEEKYQYKFSPDGESAFDVVTRFTNFLKRIVPEYKGKTICVVSHGNLMRMFLVSIGWSTFDELPTGSIMNTGYYVLQTDLNNYTVKDTYGVVKKHIDNEE